MNAVEHFAQGPGGCTNYYDQSQADLVHTAIDSEGNAWYFEYAAYGACTKITTPEGNEPAFGGDSGDGTYVYATNARGYTTYYYYAEANKLAASAREYVLANYNWADLARRTVEAYGVEA